MYPETLYRVIDIPAPSEQVMAAFADLPLDPFTPGGQRSRRFSQYRATTGQTGGPWRLELLPHRPFLQPRTVNSVAGGIQRPFPPLQIDPAPQVIAGLEALDLDRMADFQINVHQCRVVTTTPQTAGVSVPEGPHRDGHDFGMLAVFDRVNISGGVTQLFPTGGGEPFFETILQPCQALVYHDASMWHTATDIVALDDSGGHRDLWIIAVNAWERRKYGEEFERAGLTGDGSAALSDAL